MRAIFVYSRYDAKQLELVKSISEVFSNKVTVMEVDTIPAVIKALVRETPCLIQAEEHLQGEHLMQDDINQKMLIFAELFDRMDRSEKALYNVDNSRLDMFISDENNNAIDETIMDMIIEGVL